MPVYFIPNRGQMDEQVAYYVQGKDKTVYFTDEGITFALAKVKENDETSNKGSSALRPRGRDERALLRLHSWEAQEGPYEDPEKLERESGHERWVVKLDFIGANPDSHPEGLEETGTKISYFKGKPEEWKAGLPAYSKVIYRDLWPGIDLVYYGTVNRLKYEFIVYPGADPSKIRLSYRGAESVTVNEDGRLQVKTPMGGFSDDVPVAYQEIDGIRRNVEMAYKIGLPSEDKAKSSSYGFEIGDYVAGLPLVLDPAIRIYCGYVGGSGLDQGVAVAVDSAGCAYVTGYSESSEATFPATVGPDLTYSGGGDAFVAKVDTAGTALAYCGYIGGSGDDYAYGIAVDSSGNAYITGYTSSDESTFPVTVGPDLTYNSEEYLNPHDAFVAKIDAEGASLVYCGYVGGVSYDAGYGIALDGLGNAYLTGVTTSTEATFPVTVGPDLVHNGGFDAFVARVNSEGTGLNYCGYIGGLYGDYGCGIAVDGSGNAYVTGKTASTEASFPVTIGPDLTFNSVSIHIEDAFVAKLNAQGTALAYCGYIGGSGHDIGEGIAVDGSGNAYIAGTTHAYLSDFPVMVGPDLTHNGLFDAFVAKVNALGTALVYCGYIGGSFIDWGYEIAVDASGSAYIVGTTTSDQTSFPVTVGPDLVHNGIWDAFVAKVSASGRSLAFCGYIGGTDYESGTGIAVDTAGNSYVIGYAESDQATFPVTAGPDLTFNGDKDAFVAKISPEYFGYNVFDSHDYDGDGASDIAVWRPSGGVWYLRGIDNDRWGQVNDIPVPGDYNGDGFTDIAIWRPSDGIWYLRGIDNDQWGQVGDLPVPQDYDGDGRTDLAVWRPSCGTWHIRYRGGGGKITQWGQTGDFPVPGDYDGDGRGELAVWRPSNGLWYIRKVDTDRLGKDGDIPVPADYDGDGRTDLAVWRASDGTWHIRYRAGGGKVKRWGMPGDVPAPGDYDGDGIADLAVWRPSTGQWIIKNIDTDIWGTAGDIPLVR
ncbi:MAG: SBBP repeat-containing protein [Candidatus Aminicenantes bacterium]|nr:SBBP repeat-containing protein [Candidatus Aminicenantes bacterium]